MNSVLRLASWVGLTLAGQVSPLQANPTTVDTLDLVGERASITYRVPQSAAEDAVWKGVGFHDAAWSTGALGVGFDVGPTFAPFISTDLSAEMRGISASTLRIPFEAPNATFTSLTLSMRADDGFVAYLNGAEIARQLAPAIPAFDSAALGSHPDVLAVQLTSFDVSPFAGLLNPGGDNVLAIHGMNVSVGSSDYLIDARLEGEAVPLVTPVERPLEIDSFVRDASGIQLALPKEFTCQRIGVEYSPDLQAGSWLELGNFADDPEGIPRFSDPDTFRTGRSRGFYRAFLRPDP